MIKNTNRKQALKEISIFLGVSYILIISAVLHIGHLVATKRMSLAEAFGPGIKNIILRPFSIFPITPGTLSWVFGVTIALVIGAILIYFKEEAMAHYKADESMGAAKWLDELDQYNRKFTEPFDSPKHDGPNNMILSQELFMSMNNQKIRRNMNVFVIGGSGSGKSYNFVGPNLMQANCSYVVTDPSGGLFKEYGTFFEYLGYHVKCFNLSRMSDGNHYNPFNYIHGDKDVEILVTTLISNTNPPEKTGGDPFWEKSETALLVALIAYLHHYCSKSMQNFSNVMKLMRAAEINEEDSSDKSPLDYIFEEVEKKDPNSFAVKQYKTFKMGAGKTLKSILISCAVRLQAFDLEDVAHLTDTDDIDLDSVGDEKTALFVIIPTGEKTFNFLASMMYSQLFQRLYGYCEGNAKYSSIIMDSDEQVVKTFRADGPGEKAEKRVRTEAEEFFERAKKGRIEYNKKYKWWEIRTSKDELVAWRGDEDKIKIAMMKLRKGKVISNREQSNHGERLPIHTRLMLDEFANIGKIPEFPEKVATIRKYELSVAIILQSLSQMKKMYKDEWEELSGNCDNAIYLGGGADQMSTKWISELLGKETRVIMGSNHGKGGGSISLNRQGVELFAPDQLRTMDEDDCIVLMKSQFAYKGRKYMSHLHPNRKLVQDLEKKTGGYFFDAQKSVDLLNDLKGKNQIEPKISKSGGKKEVSEEEIEDREKENEYKKQQKQEYENNQDQNAEPIIGGDVDVRAKNNAFTKDTGISEPDRQKAAEESLIDTTDNSWGIDEITFGEQPMS